MAKLSTLQFLGGLVLASSAATVCLAPACTVSSGSGDNDAGAGGEGNQGGSDPSTTGGTNSTGGTSSTGGAAGAPGGGVGGDSGGTTGDAGAGGSSGDAQGGAAGESGAGGAGGASGKVCTSPTTAEMSAKGDTCDVYCAAYLSTCATFNTSDGTFTNLADCLSTCEFFDDAQLCCRAYHVRNAAVSTAQATTHCPHAGGDGVVCN